MKDKLCDVCDYVTNKTSNLKKHMKVHDKIKEEPVGPLHCPTCQKSFEIKKYLTAHMKTHLPKDNYNKEEMKEKKKCNTCSFETISNYKLQRYLKTHEKNVNEYISKIKLLLFPST